MSDWTKISVLKKASQRLTVVAAQLGIPKSTMLEKLTRVPVQDLRDLLKKADKEVQP